MGRQIFLGISVSDDVAYLTYHFGVDRGTWMQTLESGVIAVDISDPGAPERIAVYSELTEFNGQFATLLHLKARRLGLDDLRRRDLYARTAESRQTYSFAVPAGTEVNLPATCQISPSVR